MQKYIKNVKGEMEQVIGLMNAKKYEQAQEKIIVDLNNNLMKDEFEESGR